MKSGFRKTLEGIIQKTILGGLAAASLVGVSAALSCAPKPEPTPIVIAMADPWSVSADGTKAYLGYGADGKPIPFDVDGLGDRLFNFLPPEQYTYRADKVLDLSGYKVIKSEVKLLSFVAFFKDVQESLPNFRTVGIAQNFGKQYDIIIIKNYKDLGDLAITGWEAHYSKYGAAENNPIVDAIAKALGYNDSGDNGLDQPLIVIGPGLDVQTPGSEPRGKNTSYGAKVTVYKLSSQGSTSSIQMLEKIASQPPTLNPKYARNQEIVSMNIINEGGNMVLDMKISYEATDGKRYETTGKVDLSSLIQSGVPTSPSNVKPLLPLK